MTVTCTEWGENDTVYWTNRNFDRKRLWINFIRKIRSGDFIAVPAAYLCRKITKEKDTSSTSWNKKKTNQSSPELLTKSYLNSYTSLQLLLYNQVELVVFRPYEIWNVISAFVQEQVSKTTLNDGTKVRGIRNDTETNKMLVYCV